MTVGNSVTQRSIADALNITQSTVSLALCNHPRIPQETRDRVHEIARSLGYKPDLSLSYLARHHWMRPKERDITIGYISQALGPSMGGRILASRGASKQASELGYGMDFFYLSDFRNSAGLQKVLLARGIKDLIINGIYRKDLPLELDWDKFVAVASHQGIVRLGIHAVVNDHYGNVLKAWKKAVEYGYTRIGTILLDHGNNLLDDDLRMSAVIASQRRHFPHLPAIEPLEIKASLNLRAQQIRDLVCPWVKKNRIDVIIGFHGGFYYCIPEDKRKSLGFINLHLPEYEEETGTHLQAGLVDVNEYAGIEAVNLLHMCRKTNQWGIPCRRIEHMVEAIWRDGNTLFPKAQLMRRFKAHRAVEV